MMGRTGREAMLKEIRIVFSITTEEAIALDQAAESNGLSRSAFSREAIRIHSGMGPEKKAPPGSGWQRRRDRRVFA